MYNQLENLVFILRSMTEHSGNSFHFYPFGVQLNGNWTMSPNVMYTMNLNKLFCVRAAWGSFLPLNLSAFLVDIRYIEMRQLSRMRNTLKKKVKSDRFYKLVSLDAVYRSKDYTIKQVFVIKIRLSAKVVYNFTKDYSKQVLFSWCSWCDEQEAVWLYGFGRNL